MSKFLKWFRRGSAAALLAFAVPLCLPRHLTILPEIPSRSICLVKVVSKGSRLSAMPVASS
jgi:hypothetical protein